MFAWMISRLRQGREDETGEHPAPHHKRAHARTGALRGTLRGTLRARGAAMSAGMGWAADISARAASMWSSSRCTYGTARRR